MIRYISSPFRWFFKLEAASGLILLIAAIIALILSNTNLSSLYFGILNSHFLIGTDRFGLDLSLLKEKKSETHSIVYMGQTCY